MVIFLERVINTDSKAQSHAFLRYRSVDQVKETCDFSLFSKRPLAFMLDVLLTLISKPLTYCS